MNSLRATPLYNGSSVSLIAVESIDRGLEKSGAGCRLYGSIKPVAVIVCGSDDAFALGIEEGFGDIDPLLEDVPGLAALIAASKNT